MNTPILHLKKIYLVANLYADAWIDYTYGLKIVYLLSPSDKIR